MVILDKKVLFVVYHDLSTEARSSEMLQALELAFNELVCVCRKKPNYNTKATCFAPNGTGSQYLEFMKIAKREIKRIKPDILVLHDEFTAPLITYAKRKNPDLFVCYDSSELNVDRILPGLKNKISKLLYSVEKKNIRKCNLVFAANIERARIMKERFCITNPIEVFDNIHRIDGDYDAVRCEQKYAAFFQKKYTFVYGGGIAHGRYTFDLVDQFKNKENMNLLIVGSASDECKKEFEDIINTEKIDNIFFMGFVAREEWKYILEKATASFVLFKADCPNTKYCASGKMYESMFLGTPIICSKNPPLERICNEEGVGVCCENFYAGALSIIDNYQTIHESIEKYIYSIDYDNRIRKLSECILQHYLGEKR